MIQKNNMSLKVNNFKLIASNLALEEDALVCYLVADAPSGATTLYLDNTMGLAVGDIIQLGSLGDSDSELVTVSTVPNSTSIILSAATTFDHFRSTSATKYLYNEVEFGWSAEQNDATPTTLAVVAISPRLTATEYQDTTNRGFAFFRFKNGPDYSDWSYGIAYTGNPENSIYKIAKSACNQVGLQIGQEFVTEEELIEDADDALTAIKDLADWMFEKRTIKFATIDNEDTYDMTPYKFKHRGVIKGVFSVKFGSGKPINYVPPATMDSYKEGIVKVYLTTVANAGDTSIVVDDTTELQDSGTLTIGTDSITYTAVDDTTKTVSGIPASGDGSITTTYAIGSAILQGASTGEPTAFTIDEDEMIFDIPVDPSISGRYITLEYLVALDPITSIHDIIDIPFYKAIKLFMVARIYGRKEMQNQYLQWMQEFTNKVASSLGNYEIPITEVFQYYDTSLTASQAARNNNLID